MNSHADSSACLTLKMLTDAMESVRQPWDKYVGQVMPLVVKPEMFADDSTCAYSAPSLFGPHVGIVAIRSDLFEIVEWEGSPESLAAFIWWHLHKEQS